MFDLQGFVQATTNVPGHRSLVLENQRQNVSIRTRWRARWSAPFNTRENRAVTARFIEALKTHYGEESACAAAASSGLNRALAGGRPLRARHVTAARLAAEQRTSETRQTLQHLADCYEINPRQGQFRESKLSPIVEEAVRSRYAGNDSVARLLNYRDLAAKVQGAIQAEGRNGVSGYRRVDKRQADEICKSIVERELNDAYTAARDRALQHLDPQVLNTIGHQELARACATCIPPIVLGRRSLTPDAAGIFHRHFTNAIDTVTIPADELDYEDSLRQLAQETSQRFLAGWDGASAKVADIALVNDAERKVLRDHVALSTIPANLVEALGMTYFLVKDDVAKLAGPLPPVKLQHHLLTIQEAVSSSWGGTGIEVNDDNEDRLYQQAWHFLLATLDEETARAILAQIKPEHSPVREICEAATWYARDFKASDESARTFENTQHETTRVHGKTSFDEAEKYSKTLFWLWSALHERVGGDADNAPVRKANPNPNDRTVATLRNLDIPFPAPDRLGWLNENTPIADRARALMGNKLNHHLESASRDTLMRGIPSDFMQFLHAQENIPQEKRERIRARYSVDGETVAANRRELTSTLERFCMNDAGELNQELLTNICLVANPATFDCVYQGCMNPHRPDLAMVNGYPRGVFLGHGYTLWKNEQQDVFLEIGEQIRPLYYYVVNKDTVLPATGMDNHDSAHPPNPELLNDESNFRTSVRLKFDPQTFKPRIEAVQIDYAFIPGMPHTRWFLEHPFLDHRLATSDGSEQTSGSDGSEQLSGKDGSEQISGSDGSEQLSGKDGSEQISGSASMETVDEDKGLYARIGPPGKIPELYRET